MSALMKRLNRGRRLKVVAVRLMAMKCDGMTSRQIRSRARATLRIIRIKHCRNPFNEWKGDDFGTAIFLRFSECFIPLEKKLAGKGGSNPGG